MKSITSFKTLSIIVLLLCGIIYSCKKDTKRNTTSPTRTNTTTATTTTPLDFTYTDTINVFDIVSFNSNASPDSSLLWSWDFGDDSSSALVSPVHTYFSGGTYTVTLRVGSNVVRKNISVAAPRYVSAMSGVRNWHRYSKSVGVSGGFSTTYHNDTALAISFINDDTIRFYVNDIYGVQLYYQPSMSTNNIVAFYYGYGGLDGTIDRRLYYYIQNDSLSFSDIEVIHHMYVGSDEYDYFANSFR